MRTWRLERPTLNAQLDISRATRLVAAIGGHEANAFAAEVLKLFDAALSITQCTIFAYEFGNRPRTMSVADHRGGRYLRDVADTYARHFYALDGNQPIVSAAHRGTHRHDLLLHQQAGDEIAHEAYRAACYRGPDVSDRLALLVQPDDATWLSINLYRAHRSGAFQPREIAAIETLAPLIAQAAKHHYALAGATQVGIPQRMLARLRHACPELSKRELDVLRGMLEGQTAREIGETIGVKASSVVTYQKRAYRRLGISSQRELFALCMQP
ncbi:MULTISPECIES: helix-turn-helix transcriptional regulator [Burkholderia]|uniref:helix-turn-helix transcriptional regulator n=1 Tax=Burkholderia TaxID=32008 RepID=UPI00066759C8|nr:LuxR C-terminal-related transcriptional regulator [Burkholderia seminalis]AOJ24181.1 helix-turn-helix transcriptional regulator [Burkholderia seminalis]KVF50074.1 helix-turn-helix transcriptional regulator [Burkholderia seminalis]MCA8041498.1 LuxR C-terminal-related transcriptional regulator [Burkholderia seminalis]MCA8301325.1 LuxR C-terminal-related transcriptional regulator [Burkholderia seminalis]